MPGFASSSWFVSAGIMVLAGAVSSCVGGNSTAEATLAATDDVDVVSVVKGDELVVRKAGGSARLRLVGVYALSGSVDLPAFKARSEAARSYVEGLVASKRGRVTLSNPPKDVHGRYLGYLEIEGRDVGQQLIGEGHALVYTEFPFDKEAAYFEAEGLARTVGRFVWGEPTLQPTLRGLRRNWLADRSTHSGAAFDDPLLRDTNPVPTAPH